MKPVFFSGAAFSTWYPEITNRLSESSSGMKICDILSSNGNKTASAIFTGEGSECHVEVQDKMFIDAMVLGVGYLISYTIIVILSRRMRIFYIIAAAMIISTASGFLLPLLTNEVLIVTCFSLFIVGSGSSICIVNILFVDIFPVFICGMAIAISVLSGRIGTIIGNNLFGILLETQCETVMFGTSMILAIGLLILFILPRKVNPKVTH